MPDGVKPNKAESQMTLASARSTSEDRRVGWWAARSRLEKSLLVLCTFVLFVVVALCLGMAAVISGYASNNFFTADRPVVRGSFTHKYKRSVVDVQEPTHDSVLIDEEITQKILGALPSNSKNIDAEESPVDDLDSLTITKILTPVLSDTDDDNNNTNTDTDVENDTNPGNATDDTDFSKTPDATETKLGEHSPVGGIVISISKPQTTKPEFETDPSQGPFVDTFFDASDEETVASDETTAIRPVKTPVKSFTKTSTGSQSNTAGQDICLTKQCVTSASELVNNMDDTVDPCEDFFEYACGNYLKTKIIPDEKASVSQFSDVSDTLQEKLRTLVENRDNLIDIKDTPSSTKVKKLFKSCMDTDSIAKRGLEPLKEVLKEMGGWPAVDGDNWNQTNFEWFKNIYINRKLGYSVDLILDFSITPDIKNSSWRIIDIDQPPLGMPSRKYLLRGVNDSDVQAYLEYQVGLAELLGANRTTAKEQLTESLEFEIKVANLTLPKEERRNASKLYNRMTIGELQQKVPNVPWIDYINTVLAPYFTLNTSEPVVVNVPTFIIGMGKLLEETPKRTIANYMMWRAAASSVSYLSDDARDLQLSYSKKITGTGKRQPRWKECMGAVSGSLSHAVGKLYAERFFKKNAKDAADEMVAYIRAEFDKILRTVDWMDDETRVRAINKSLAITPHIAYPEELLIEAKLTELYNGLEISDGEFLSNMRNLTIFGTNYSFRRLREKVNKNDWKSHGAAAVVNAFYSPLQNSIQFPAGILQGVFFDADRPKYQNYGAIGFVIGHEITHGFDDMGRQFDYKGDLKEWWLPETKAKFLEKSKCIIDQYNSYTAPEVNMTLNGVNTQGENIADNGGIKEAYYAYKQWATDHGSEAVLPALNLTTKQLFWVSAANVWCGKYRPETLKLRILTGAHSPARFRVNGPLSNLPEFSDDWNCKPNTKMNPLHKCTVW